MYAPIAELELELSGESRLALQRQGCIEIPNTQDWTQHLSQYTNHFITLDTLEMKARTKANGDLVTELRSAALL